MKNKILAILLMATLTLSMVACGSNDSSGESNNNDAVVEDNADDATENVEDEQESEPEAPVDDGIIDFEGEGFKVTYTRHEVGTDYEGNPCLYYYFDFTNNGEENTSAMVTAYIQCFQGGIECESAITDEYNDEMDNYMKDIQPGTTLEVCEVFELSDNSEVTLEASDWVSFSDEKDVQKITLE